MEQAVSWEEGPMLRTTVLALQQPVGRDLEPQGKRTPTELHAGMFSRSSVSKYVFQYLETGFPSNTEHGYL